MKSQNKDKLLTVVTITYNRKNKLKRLINSLQQQQCKDFKWLVVDDGSSDGTVEYIKQIRGRVDFPINIIRNNNIGKYKEINYILPIISTKLMILLDSDDYLIEGGIQLIKKYWRKYSHMNDIGSIIFEMGNGTKYKPMHKIDHELIDKRYYYLAKTKTYGDYSDVFVTDAISNYRFPEFKEEKFMSEGPLYYFLSQKKKSAFIPQILIIASYLDDGLTHNVRKNQINNYRGTLFETNLYLNNDTPLFFRIKKAILYDYIALSCLGKFSLFFKKSNYKFLLALCLPIAMLFFIKDKMSGF